MTLYEHAMVGINGAMAAGLHRRHGWPIVAMAGFAAMLPDWDGLTILLGARCYAYGHRVWGHNLIVAALVAMLVSGIAYRFEWPIRIQGWMGKRWSAFALEEDAVNDSLQSIHWRMWLIVGLLAAYSHLLADIVFSAGRDGQIWGVPLWWPFSDVSLAYPLVFWGDVGVTLIFVAGMFAMIRWREWVRTIAGISLALAISYIALRGCFS